MPIKKKLQIRISSEPNRLSEINLSNAYEKLIPIIKYPMNIKEKEEEDMKRDQQLILKGNLKW